MTRAVITLFASRNSSQSEVPRGSHKNTTLAALFDPALRKSAGAVPFGNMNISFIYTIHEQSKLQGKLQYCPTFLHQEGLDAI